MKCSTFAEVLKAWVGDRRLVDVAEVLGVAISTLSVRLNGGAVPWDREAVRIAAIIGFDRAELLRLCAADRRRLQKARKGAARGGAAKQRQQVIRSDRHQKHTGNVGGSR